MIISLNQAEAFDLSRVGAKAAYLARALQAGLPVLPGFAVDSAASRRHIALGESALRERGSGGARLTIAHETIEFGDSLIAAGCGLGERLVVRSSTALEETGKWSGAFASYTDVTPDEVPKAIAGCWASAFSPSALARQEAASILPGSFDIAVLVQPFLPAQFGGIAELKPSGSVVVRAVRGSPAALLQGWGTGSEGERDPAGRWTGDELAELIGVPQLDALCDYLEQARSLTGASRCEWAINDQAWILQLNVRDSPESTAPPPDYDIPSELIPAVQALVSFPGPLGEELVLPWAIGGAAEIELRTATVPRPDLNHAKSLALELTSQVWGLPAEKALRRAKTTLGQLQTGSPKAIAAIRGLNRPTQSQAQDLLSTIEAIRRLMAESGLVPHSDAAWYLSLADIEQAVDTGEMATRFRVGPQKWEPLIAAAVMTHGRRLRGIPASAGIGAGVGFDERHIVQSGVRHRGVLTAYQPHPALAPMLWDATGVVTKSGSAAAHLFESARSLGVPAVCGVDIGEDQNRIVCVDGFSGTVASLPRAPNVG